MADYQDRCEKLLETRTGTLMRLADARDALKLGRTETALQFIELAHERLLAADDYKPAHVEFRV